MSQTLRCYIYYEMCPTDINLYVCKSASCIQCTKTKKNFYFKNYLEKNYGEAKSMEKKFANLL